MAKAKKAQKTKSRFTSIYLDEGRLDSLKQLSKRTLISQQALLRMGIDLMFRKFKVGGAK